MFIPVWLICVIGILVIGEIWTLHDEREGLKKALRETQQKFEKSQHGLVESQQEPEETKHELEETKHMVADRGRELEETKSV